MCKTKLYCELNIDIAVLVIGQISHLRLAEPWLEFRFGKHTILYQG